ISQNGARVVNFIGQNKIFSQGLENIRRTVANCENIVLVSRSGIDQASDLNAMLERGWVLFELFIARNRMRIPLALYEPTGANVQYGRNERSWRSVVPDIATLVPFDSAELIHAWFKYNGIVCTNGSDLAYLARLLHEELIRPEHEEIDFEVLIEEE